MKSSIILEKYGQSPHGPGVYLMKDSKGQIIYVGKAKDLKKRLSSYFMARSGHDPKTKALLAIVKDFEIIITSSDHEAFILESNLIKQHNPKYNVFLKDGKNYPLLRINMQHPFPAIQKVRKIKKDNALYFGPYSSGFSVNKTMKQIQKIFKIRRCKDSQFKTRTRPCLNFQIKACLGPCCNYVDTKEYETYVKNAVLFLKGKSKQVIKKLDKKMSDYSLLQQYEQAAQMRDSIFAIENIMKKQVVVSSDLKDRDVIAFACKKGIAIITLMIVRSGFLIDTAHYSFDLLLKNEDEFLSTFLDEYYKEKSFLPSFILLSQEIENKEFLEDIFTKIKGKKVSINVPYRGRKRQLIEMAKANAVLKLDKILQKQEEQRAIIVMLKDLLNMEKLPQRIECFDNSNLAGHDPVSSMVVFEDGKPYKDDYRKYIIRNIDFSDDYACMYQVLKRRFSKKTLEISYPDLLLVDGGKGQLGIAVAVLKELNIYNKFMVAGIAKKNELKNEKFDKIYVPKRSNPLSTSSAKKALYLLEQVRDEAHRFAIIFQRKRREKIAQTSILDTIKGIGPKKKKILLEHFKGVSNMKSASIDEIAALPGMNEALAQVLLDGLGDL